MARPIESTQPLREDLYQQFVSDFKSQEGNRLSPEALSKMRETYEVITANSSL